MNTVAPPVDDQVTLGDKRVETSTFDRYKGRKGITDRVAMVSGGLIRAYSFYYEGQGKNTLFRAPTDPDTLKFVKAQLGEPSQRFGLVLFHYLTDEKGELVTTETLKGRMKTWVISETRYEELSSLHRQWPILDGGFDKKQHDIMVNCTEEKFQRMTFNPTPDAFWKKKQSWYDALKAKELKAKERLRGQLGRTLKDTEIMALLGAALPSQTGSTDNAGEIDLSDIAGAD